MRAGKSDRACSKLANVVTAVMLAMGAHAASSQGLAADSVLSAITEAHQYGVSADLEDLKRAFWRCDYIAIVQGMEFAPVSLCLAVSEEIRIRMFEGDSRRMQAWWKQSRSDAFEAQALHDETRHR